MFAYDGPAYRFLKKIMDVTILHLLWLVTSLPLVTLGASTTALYGVSLRRRTGDESQPMSQQFFSIFRSRWKQGTLLMLVVLGAAALLAIDMYYWNHVASGVFAQCMAVVSLALVVPLALLAMYGFAVVSIREDGTWSCMKMALWTAYAHPMCSLKLGIFWALAVMLNLTTLYVNIIFLIIGFGTFVHVCLSRTLVRALEGMPTYRMS